MSLFNLFHSDSNGPIPEVKSVGLVGQGSREFMERNQFWIFLALGLAIGACLEIMKAPSSQPVHLAGFTHFETLLEEGKEVHVLQEVKPVSNRRSPREEEPIIPQKIASNDIEPQAIEPAADSTATVKPAVPLTEEEKKKKEEEEKKKKALLKKKKLKAKKKKEEAERKQRDELEAQAKEQEEKEKKTDDKSGNGEVAAQQPGSAFPIQPVLNDDGLPKTVPEWEAYLMKEANYERMAKFVKLFQTGSIKGEVFYPVVEAMLQDSRPRIRSLAVAGLSSTPSEQSFTTLFNARNDADTGVRKDAQSAIAQYSHLQNLKFLMAVITGQNESDAVIEGMHLLRISAETNIKLYSAAHTQGSGRTPATAALTRYYTPFLTALRHTASQSHDSNIRTTATQTLTELQSVIANIPQQTP